MKSDWREEEEEEEDEENHLILKFYSMAAWRADYGPKLIRFRNCRILFGSCNNLEGIIIIGPCHFSLWSHPKLGFLLQSDQQPHLLQHVNTDSKGEVKKGKQDFLFSNSPNQIFAASCSLMCGEATQFSTFFTFLPAVVGCAD